MITVTVKLDAVTAALTRLKGLGGGVEFFGGIGDELKQKVVDGFLGAQDPWGDPWADLSPITIKNRIKQGFGVEPLIRTFELMLSVGAVSRADGVTLEAGGGLPDARAEFNQEGTSTAPARPFFPIVDGEADLPDSWMDVIDNAFTRQFAAAFQ